MPTSKKTSTFSPPTKRLSGRTVVDATKNLALRIIKDDVTSATPADPSNCAVARAVIRLQNADEVLIHQSRAYVRKGEVWTRYTVPEAIQREIIAFDRGAEFVPGEYQLRAPNTSHQLGSYPGRPSTTKKGTGLPRRMPVHITKGVRMDMPGGKNLYKELGA